ncbi:hypothetical protein AWC38_SpisGene7939 [Stylophora pistillata]|uniref:Transmembrane protein n=1 Tax=Stylophora pistillata TaxID=50429 RepID=A0A2B4SFR5_STYPI|nr:hypothetical protein AWC38_SpisGene7939 [Stylophora pistillata]
MSRKRTLIGTSVCFVAVLYGLLLVSTFQPQLRDAGYDVTSPDISLYLSNIEFRSLKDLQTYFEDFDLKAPSLVSFLKASTTEVNQNLNFNGLAVVSNLTDACQPLVDVAKARVRVNKIAFIQIMTESATACSLCELAVKAQNAGYSMVIFPSLPPSKLLEGNCSVKTVDKLLIPVVVCIRDYFPRSPPPQVTLDSMLSHAHQSDVHIRVSLLSNDLETMAKYLENLYIWFLVGPIITLVWLRRNKILCCVTTVRLVDDESSNEEIMGECPRDYIHQALIFTNHTQTSTIIVRLARIFGRSIRYLALGLGYVILTLAPLPVGALNNLKLTALRTLALGLTLTLSFSTSMHIIRKLMKPQESVFEGVSQR